MFVMRHSVVLGALGISLGACAPGDLAGLVEAPAAPPPVEVVEPPQVAAPVAPPAPRKPAVDPELAAMYASRRDGNWTLAAIDVGSFEQRFLRQRVPFETSEAPGTVIVDTKSRHLYLVEPDGMATRYGVSIGREGFGWTGEGRIGRKARWPRWTPPSQMIERDPSLEKWRAGMPGGPSNPLGARALYIYFGDQDSLYRVHGTNEPRSVGRAASSGCFRMLNQDVIDLHARVATGAKIIVR
jgi:lipoprotein-anchoring transpeptidase ErfK/SrfK